MQTLEKALRWTILAGIFALPFICFIVAKSLFFPFITGKNFTFRVIVEIITGAWLALALIYPLYRPRRSWVLACFSIFVVVLALADALGVNPFKSFWSNFERMDGWVTLGHLLLLLVVSVSVLDSEKLWRRFWQTSLWASAAAGVYGFLQIGGTLALGQGGANSWSARIDATFGNPIYLAVYMLFHVFIAALLWLQMWRERRPGTRMLPSIFYGGVILIDVVTLLFTSTRGTILGLIGGALLALILFAFSGEATAKLRRITVAAFVAICILGGGLWVARNTPFVHSIGFLERLTSISLSDGTTKARFLNMGMAWQGVKERPILGWGQENYAIVFDKYYDPQMYAQEPWFDRVHNSIFDWLVAGGFLGLISYLSIFAAALLALWKRGSRHGHGGFSAGEKSILTGLLAGYFFHNIFVFDNVTSYILFALVLAYITWRASEAAGSARVVEAQPLPKSALPFVVALCAVAVWGLAWFVNAQALTQNRTLLQALSPQSSGATANLALFKQAAANGSYGTQEAREQLAQAATQVAGGSFDIAVKQQFFDTATHEMTLQAAASPLDARFPLFLGILQDAFGDTADASIALEKAHELSPKKQSILFQIGLNQTARGDTAGALVTFKQAYDLAPEFHDALFYYTAAAIRAHQDTLADQLLAPLMKTGDATDARVTAAYADRKLYGKIVAIYKAHVQAHPEDIQGYFTLAAAYVGAGDGADAIATLQAVELVAPSAAPQADNFIQQIRNGTAKVQ